MKMIAKSLALVVLPLFTAGAWADVTQDCILEGTVDKRKAEQAGKDVYVAFHSAKGANRDADCNIGRRNNRVEFKQSKDSGIENAPHGATVKYRYTEEDNDKGQWKLLDVSKF